MFLSIFEREYLRPKVRDTNKRAKFYLDFFEQEYLRPKGQRYEFYFINRTFVPKIFQY